MLDMKLPSWETFVPGFYALCHRDAQEMDRLMSAVDPISRRILAHTACVSLTTSHINQVHRAQRCEKSPLLPACAGGRSR